MEEIDLKSDFLTFKTQITQKFGEQYFEQVDLFFQRATTQAEHGLFLSALADGKFALELSNFSSDRSNIHYLIGFLSQLHCDLGQIANSNAYYELGLKLLDPDSPSYEDDKELFRNLKELIDGERWKGSVEDNEE